MLLFNLLLLASCLGCFGKDYNEPVQVIEPDSKNDRPCELDDLKCIRKEFIRRGWCSQSLKYKQSPEQPFKVSKIEYEQLYFKLTTIQRDIQIEGLQNGEIIEFFINKETDTAVFSVSFSDISVCSSNELILHRKSDQNIIIKAPTTTEQYPNIITTTIITGLKFKSQQKSHAHVCVQPEYSFGNTDNIKNEEVLEVFEKVASNIDVGVDETFGSRAQLFVDFYVQNVVCNILRGKKTDSDDKGHKITVTLEKH